MLKTQSERERLVRITQQARQRYQRRLAMTDWFWAYYKARWNEQPRLITRVASTMRRSVPVLASAPRRQRHICFEDCLHLADQALILLTRLQHGTTQRRS